MSRVLGQESQSQGNTTLPVDEVAGAELRTYACRMHRGSNCDSLLNSRPEHLWFNVFVGRFFEVLHCLYQKKVCVIDVLLARTFICTRGGREVTANRNQSKGNKIMM
jgi:hypothetical protein